MKHNIRLLRSGIRNAFPSHTRPVISILLQKLANILQSTVKFVDRIQFAELEFRGVHDLVVTGMARSSLHIHGAHEQIRRRGEPENDRAIYRSHFGLNVSKEAG